MLSLTINISLSDRLLPSVFYLLPFAHCELPIHHSQLTIHSFILQSL